MFTFIAQSILQCFFFLQTRRRNHQVFKVKGFQGAPHQYWTMFRASNFHRTAAAHPTSSHLDLILENQTPTHIYVYSLCLNPRRLLAHPRRRLHSNTAARSPDRAARQTTGKTRCVSKYSLAVDWTANDKVIFIALLQYSHRMAGPQSAKGISEVLRNQTWDVEFWAESPQNKIYSFLKLKPRGTFFRRGRALLYTTA